MRGKLSRELCTIPKHCKWCGQKVPKRRRSWCSDKCVREYQNEAFPSYTYQCVRERDQEICKLCGRNLKIIQAKLNKRIGFKAPNDLRRKWVRFLKLLKIKHLWEIDHIVPVCEGGTSHLDNLRTLCVWCHKQETKLLIARRKSSDLK
jgi:5-methylcytosine-specific restriction protein A